jgi:Lon protease-like protein
MEWTELPLFPLYTVLFPGVGQALNIFEDRYKQLLADCLRTNQRFGIVGIESGQEVGGAAEPYRVGCLAQITEIDNVSEGEQYVVQVAGLERIRILELDRESKPYLSARVELWPDEADAEPAAAAAGQAGTLFNDYVRALLRESGRESSAAMASLPLQLPSDPTLISIVIGALVQVPIEEKQHLLEAPSAGARLTAEIQLLNRELALLKLTHAGPELEALEGRSHFSMN